MNPESGGMLYFTGNATISGKFTKKAFEEVVKPPLIQLPKLLKILPIAEDEKVQFSNFVIRGVKAYSARYALGFRSYYDAFGIEANTVGALRYVLNQIQLPSSQFQNLLFTIRENTVFEIENNPFTEPFAVRLREFDSFKRIFREDKGIYPEMEKYKAILGQMQQDLENSKPFVPKNAADDAKELKSRLSPAGRIAFSIFRSEEDSYLNMVKMWISSAGISPQWDRLFAEPVLQAYEIGMADAESLVDKTWKTLLRSDIRPIVKQFPFDKRSDSITDPAELEAVIHPQGRFWKTATALFAPVCIRNNSEWQERKGFRLPDDMIKTLNDAE
ncbi:MAG: hypothetical protein HC887_09040, partial [Desulfobacteraceae bacterium]|nr:hypothetical protein [Desulfobacteraceae bacterium]